MVVASLFLTGLAQKEILPRVRARMDQTMAAARQKARKAEPAAVPADSLAARRRPRMTPSRPC